MRRTVSALLAVMVVIALVGAQESVAQGVNPDNLRARVLAAVNTARIANNLAPYAVNSILTEAAQAHSDYQCATGEITHEGEDGDTAFERVTALGYPAVWVNENIYGGRGEPEDAVRWWLTADEAHRNNVLHETLREVGIGIGVGEDGTICYTMDISAQPGVLPVFINGGAETTDNARVGLTLTTEAVFTGGDSVGTPTQVMISNSPDFADPTLLPWAGKIAWTLDVTDGSGSTSVFVRYIDAVGRTADASDSIIYVSDVTLTPTLTPSATAMRETTTPITESEAVTEAATATVTATASATTIPPTATASETPTVQATMTATHTATPAPSATAMATSTATPDPRFFTIELRLPRLRAETPRQQYVVAAIGAGALALIILYLIIRSRG